MTIECIVVEKSNHKIFQHNHSLSKTCKLTLYKSIMSRIQTVIGLAITLSTFLCLKNVEGGRSFRTGSMDVINDQTTDIELICGSKPLNDPIFKSLFEKHTDFIAPACLIQIYKFARASPDCRRYMKRKGSMDQKFSFDLFLASPKCRIETLKKFEEYRHGHAKSSSQFSSYTNDINCGTVDGDTNTTIILRGMGLETATKAVLSAKFDGRFDGNLWDRFYSPLGSYVQGKALKFQINDDTYECVQKMPKYNPLCPFKSKKDADVGADFWRRQIFGIDACETMVARMAKEVKAEIKLLKRFGSILCSFDTKERVIKICKSQSLPCSYLSAISLEFRRRQPYFEWLWYKREKFCNSNQYNYVYWRSELTRSKKFREIIEGFSSLSWFSNA